MVPDQTSDFASISIQASTLRAAWYYLCQHFQKANLQCQFSSDHLELNQVYQTSSLLTRRKPYEDSSASQYDNACDYVSLHLSLEHILLMACSCTPSRSCWN